MKRTKYVLIAILALMLLGSTVAIYAGPEDPPGPGDPPGEVTCPPPRPLRGLRGEVTAVSATGLTLLTRPRKPGDEVSVQVNADEDTRIWLVETHSTGSLDDVEVGDQVLVRGRRTPGSGPDAPEVDARAIVVCPDGDEVHGRVTVVQSNVITLATRRPEEPEGEATVITNDETEFRLGRRPGSLEDVTEGKRIVAFGETQADGSLLATLVVIDHRPPPLRNVRGEVTAVSATGLTLLTRPRKPGDEVSVQVNADENTHVWLVETQSTGSLDDVEAGDQVLVRGRRAEGSEPESPEMNARAIVVAPDGDEVHGRVSAVEGNVITLVTRRPEEPEGEATVLASEATEFRRCAPRRGCRAGSLEDVAEGRVVVAFGETQADGSLQARLVFLHPRAGNSPGGNHPGGDDPGMPGGPVPGPEPYQGEEGPGAAPLPDHRLGAGQS